MYYPDGTIKSKWKYRGGKLDGVSRFYDKRGQLRNTHTYKDGKLITKGGRK